MKTKTKQQGDNPIKKVWFVNSEGKRVGFPLTATIAELAKAGAKVELCPKGTRPTKTRFINEEGARDV